MAKQVINILKFVSKMLFSSMHYKIDLSITRTPVNFLYFFHIIFIQVKENNLYLHYKKEKKN